MSKYHKRHHQQQKPVDNTAVQAAAAPSQPSRRVSLTPLAPLVVRSGRPFDGQSGSDLARLPPPSTLAGCMRTAWALATSTPFSPALLDMGVTGPLLARGETLLLPRPVDAHYFVQDAGPVLVRAAPRPFEPGCNADLPEGLLPVYLTTDVRGKPGPGPAWWAWEDWLAFRQGQPLTHTQVTHNGWTPPAGERRTHVAIDPATNAAAAGKLFQTQGMDLGADPAQPGIRLLAEFDQPLGEAVVHLGGERRLAALAPHAGVWPSTHGGWWKAITGAGGLSLTLVTPGLFGAGYRPGWLDANLCGSPPGCPEVRLRLRAAALERWQPHSGWDLAQQQPRATRKLIPAGAVYWFDLLEVSTPQSLQALWLTSLCDGPQDRRDGFGLALPAAWQPPHTP